MKFEEILEYRYACKRYDKEKKINEEDMMKLVKAAALAPTSCNMQHAHLLLINKEEKMEQINEICFNQGTTRTAPNAIVILAGKKNYMGVGTPRYKEVVKGLTDRLNTILPEDKKITEETVDKNCATFCNKEENEYMAWSKANSYLVAMNIMNQASSLKIDSCPIEGFSQEKFDEFFPEYKENYEVALVISLGYRSEKQPIRSRLSIDDLYTLI